MKCREACNASNCTIQLYRASIFLDNFVAKSYDSTVRDDSEPPLSPPRNKIYLWLCGEELLVSASVVWNISNLFTSYTQLFRISVNFQSNNQNWRQGAILDVFAVRIYAVNKVTNLCSIKKTRSVTHLDYLDICWKVENFYGYFFERVYKS